MSSPLWAGKFKSFRRPPEEASLNVPHSPEIVVSFRTVALSVDNTVGTFPYARQLSLSIEKELTGAFSVLSSGAEGRLSVSVLEFGAPATRVYSVMESRILPSNPGQSILAAIVPQKVPVTYWEAQGLITLKTVLKDRMGAIVDEAIVRAPFQMKRETAVNNVTTVDQNALPKSDVIMSDLLLEGARRVRQRYAIGLESIRLKLAVDDELLPGNHLAMEGNWEGALRAWESVSMKSNPGDRQFNLALANYALAFQAFADSQNANAAAAKLAEGSRLLAEAEHTDPKESYFKEAESRLAAAKIEMDKAVQQSKALEIERERKAEVSEISSRPPANVGVKSLDRAQLDTPKEVEFRKYVRMQWKNRTQSATDSELATLQETGRIAWKLSSEQAQHVVDGEAQSWKELQEKGDLYLTNLKSFLNGNVLSAEGRQQLRKLSQNLGLTDAEVTAIESKIPFREEGKPRHPAKRGSPKINTQKPPGSGSTN